MLQGLCVFRDRVGSSVAGGGITDVTQRGRASCNFGRSTVISCSMGAEFALSFGWPVTVEKAWIRAIFRRWAAQTSSNR